VRFPAHQTTYGLVRDSEWGQAAIPVADLRGTAIDLRMLSYEFVILEENGTSCEFAIDDIYWDSGVISAIGDGDVTVRRPALLANAPNPFNARTELRFTLPAAGAYEIAIFDMAGRRVSGWRATGAAGANAVTWDGRDAAGNAVASGVYCYQLRTGAGVASRRMMLVK